MDNYIPLALRTKSDQFHPDIIKDHDSILNLVRFAGAYADQLKKALFYGKTPKVEPFERVAMNLHKVDVDLLHAVLGIVTEAAEMIDGLVKGDRANLKEEGGDVLWYLAILFDALGTDFDTEMRRNIAKLRTRYPQKFTTDHAVNRDLAAEAQALHADS